MTNTLVLIALEHTAHPPHNVKTSIVKKNDKYMVPKSFPRLLYIKSLNDILPALIKLIPIYRKEHIKIITHIILTAQLLSGLYFTNNDGYIRNEIEQNPIIKKARCCIVIDVALYINFTTRKNLYLCHEYIIIKNKNIKPYRRKYYVKVMNYGE